MKYIICDGKNGTFFNATIKPRKDIENILDSEGINKIFVSTTSESYKLKKSKICKFVEKLNNLFKWNKEIIKFKKGDIVIIQYPLKNPVLLLHKIIEKYKSEGAKVCLLIHDLDFIRFEKNNNLARKKDKLCIQSASCVICHNNNMIKYVEDNFEQKNLINLEIFDYLIKDEKISNNIENNKGITICYAGNLSKDKSPFLYQINEDDINFSVNVYGIGIENDINNKIRYIGKYLPDELPNHLFGDFGLVWDGNYDDSDENHGFKKYTKYNNPHKASCYIAAGLPLIVWSKSAISQFVKKYNIGYTIDNIYDINNLSKENYDEIKRNVLTVRNDIINGNFTKRAIKKIELEDYD